MGLRSHRLVRVPMLIHVHSQKCQQWAHEHKKVAWSNELKNWSRKNGNVHSQGIKLCTLYREVEGLLGSGSEPYPEALLRHRFQRDYLPNYKGANRRNFRRWSQYRNYCLQAARSISFIIGWRCLYEEWPKSLGNLGCYYLKGTVHRSIIWGSTLSGKQFGLFSTGAGWTTLCTVEGFGILLAQYLDFYSPCIGIIWKDTVFMEWCYLFSLF